jgi:hypothetical protein
LSQKKATMTRRIDPEPITIYMAVAATYAAAVATVNFVKTHYPTLPTQVRAGLLRSLARLEMHAKGLRADTEVIRGIFRDAKFARGRTIRFGNNAELTDHAFRQYMKVCDNVLRRLREAHNLSLKMERQATRAKDLQLGPVTNVLGETYAKVERLLDSRNLSFDQAWDELDSIAAGLEDAIRELRGQIGNK